MADNEIYLENTTLADKVFRELTSTCINARVQVNDIKFIEL